MKKLAMFFLGLALVAGCQAQPKTLVLFGDSYTTFEGCIPEGYACWYTADRMGNDVKELDSTWWRILAAEKGYELLLNSSYSGSTIGNLGYGGEDYSDRSFVTRMKTDIVTEDGKPGRCGQIPDLLLIFGGTNDSWCGEPAGELLPKERLGEADLYQGLPATCVMLDYLTKRLPKTRIVMIINSELKPEYTEGLARASEMYGVECVQLKDIHKQMGHPSKAGMRAIAEQVAARL